MLFVEKATLSNWQRVLCSGIGYQGLGLPTCWETLLGGGFPKLGVPFKGGYRGYRGYRGYIGVIGLYRV